MNPSISVIPKACIILVNWNNGEETLACLQSITQSSYSAYHVIICDNHSTDGSHLRLSSFLSSNYPLTRHFEQHTVSLRMDPRIESFTWYDLPSAAGSQEVRSAILVLIRTRANLGFAGGNNTAVAFAKRWFSPDYYWLLNNDTRVNPNTLSALIARMSSDPEAGICGATILSWNGQVQTLGGCRYLKWAGTAAPLYGGRSWPLKVEPQDVEKSMEYVAGASMLVSARFIETVGLMDEGYFLYFEEIDWARRAAGRFTFRYAPEAIVFHREGGTIGSSQSGIRRSERSFYWLCRSRIRFTMRHHPAALPTVLFFSVMNALRWALPSRNLRIFTLCIRGILDAFFMPHATSK